MANVSIKHVKSVTVADWAGVVTVGNSTGGTATAQGSDLARPSDWNSSHAVTFGLSASDIPAMSFFEPFSLPQGQVSALAKSINTWYFSPILAPFGLTSGQVRMYQSRAAAVLFGTTFSATSTGSMSKVATVRNVVALYSQMSSASSSIFTSVWTNDVSILVTHSASVSGSVSGALTMTNAATISFPSQFDISGGMTYGTSSQSGTKSSAASTMASSAADSLVNTIALLVSGFQMVVHPFATTLPAGAYVFAHMVQTSSATSGTRYTQGGVIGGHAVYGMSYFNAGPFMRPGSTASAATPGDAVYPLGFLATSSTGATGSFAMSDVSYTTAPVRDYWQLVRTSH